MHINLITDAFVFVFLLIGILFANQTWITIGSLSMMIASGIQVSIFEVKFMQKNFKGILLGLQRDTFRTSEEYFYASMDFINGLIF